ncbi:lipid A biosynthesis lauroyl acyltransferase [Silanimonas sp.]|uniref:lysophospholipid acyltransferase family protein n=1 Tax=Silanimonas sp. TaxID=1929290 RepID=UPI0022BEE25B|nr:lipid A biosynthesis lauroyl acyltransferase [Silanimonas sp.]MCZ8062618.1 lipid A biosynthesis lauroyl acyltransferase [Silanimonas sp.]
MSTPRCFGWRAIGVAAAVLARLPQRATLAFGASLGVLLRPLLRRRWHVARVNLALCFAAESAVERERRLRDHQRSLAVALLELLRAWFAPSATLDGLAEVEGLALLRDASAKGQGVLLLTGHLMHTELATRFVAEALGAPVGGVVRRYRRHPCLERLLDAARTRRLGPTVGKFDTRGMARHLRNGGRLVYSADQDFREGHAFVPFFGVPAATFVGTPQLARAGRAVVRFLSMVRGPDGRYRVRIADPGLDDRLDDPAGFAAQYMAVLEAAVGEAPDQYLWVHRRFKTRPSGEASPYAR